MTITAAQIRGGRRLLRRSSATLSAQAGVGFSVVLKAQLDAEIGSVDTFSLRAIEEALTRSGVRLTAGGGVSLQKMKPTSIKATHPDRSPDV
ncbi:hypothetical protein D3273_13370 [Lichenibacterium minor]|uniref:Uncharacterized protein n=1 Tax=Lichenibacterium minor TaxID=2316528 RepID=A0A4V1RUJ5_9HYPH|nr:hypothetical protein [Lichenibacterium minor]RYC31374.1 hypothetical protein D3273_13370 [Lichenibacterium minor]